MVTSSDELQQALAQGPAALPLQIQALLNAAEDSDSGGPVLYPENPITTEEARLSALIGLADWLDEAQRATLHQQVQTLEGDARLHLQVRLAAVDLLPYRDQINRFWDEAQMLDDPVRRSQILLQLVPLLDKFKSGDQPTSYMVEMVELARETPNTDARIRSLTALAPHLPPYEGVRLLRYVLEQLKGANDTLCANTISAIADKLPGELEDKVIAAAQNIKTITERARALTALAKAASRKNQYTVRAGALTTIAGITGEDDRAAALVNFVPYLEPASEEDGFSDLLQQALTIAISLVKRPLRARALVALAPYLTLDLQGEALAAVHAVTNERERAVLLAELAPNLPPDMLVASLAFANTMKEQDSRVHALSVLAHHVPEHVQQRTLLDALAAAANLPHHYERVRALIGLMDILPPHLHEQAQANALDTARQIENENARARAYAWLGPHLHAEQLSQGVESIRQIKDPEQRLNALMGLPDHRTLLLETVRQIKLDYRQARALVLVAPQLADDDLPPALAIADTLEDPVDRANAYLALAPRLEETARTETIRKVRGLIDEIDTGYDRSTILAALLPFTQPADQPELAETASRIVKSITDDYDRFSALSILAPLFADGGGTPLIAPPEAETVILNGLQAALAIPQVALREQQLAAAAELWRALPPEPRYHLWRQMAEQLVKYSYADVLLSLNVLRGVIESLASDEQRRAIVALLV